MKIKRISDGALVYSDTKGVTAAASTPDPDAPRPVYQDDNIKIYRNTNNLTGTKVVSAPADPLVAAARNGGKPAVQPNKPNLDINAFGAGDTSGGAKMLGNILAAAGNSAAGNFAEALGQITQPTGLTIGEELRQVMEGKYTEADRQAAEKAKAERIRENIQDPLYAFSDKMAEKSATHTEKAKEGLDPIGRTLVDVSITGTQLLGDIALGAINPALGTGAMATRVFGGSAQEARQAGATETQQQVYGLANAAVSVAVEKLSQVGNAFKKAYGGSIAGGSVDDVITKIVGKIVKNPTAKQIIASALGEAGEEGLEAIIQPVLKTIYDKGETLNHTWFGNKDELVDYLSDVGYNALIGGILGGIGAGGNVQQTADTTVTAQEATPNAPASRVGVEGDNNTLAQQNGTEAIVGANKAVTANRVNSLAKDPAALAELGIDPNGKTASQLRAEVREKLTGVTQSDVNAGGLSEVAAPVETPAVDPMVQTARASANPVGRARSASMRTNELASSLSTLSRGRRKVVDGYSVGIYMRNGRDTATLSIVTPSGERIGQLVDGGRYWTNRQLQHRIAEIIAEHEAQKSRLSTQRNVNNTARSTANPARDVFAEDVRNRAAERNDSVGAARAGFDRYTALENEYGTLPEKKNPYRPDDVPASITGEDMVSENAVSMKSSELTKDEFVPVIDAAVLRGDFSFQGLSNNRVVRESIRKIKAKGFRKAYAEWKSAMEKGSADPELTARAMLMYNIAQEAGDNDLALDILLDAQANTRESARVVQINRLWQTMRPEAQLAALYRKAERISNERAKKKAGNVPVDEWMTRVGQDLAAHIKQRMNVSEAQAQTVSQTILSDLKQMYAEDNPKPKMGKKKRSTIDRLHDLLENFDKYSEAAEVAKANMLEGIEDEELRNSIGEWFDTLPEFGRRLARELTGDEGITIPDDLAKKYLAAETDAARDEVLDEIAKKVAEQTPTSLGEIYSTLRYVNMLFNIKTQVRNVAGNVVMSVVDNLRNSVEVGLQKLTGVEKTRVTKVDAEHKAIGIDDYENVKRGLESQQKYKDGKFTGDDFAMRVDDAKKLNNTGSKLLDKPLAVLQKANEWTSWMLNNDKFGDAAFLKKHYANALGGYLQAHGITAEQWNDANWQADNAEKVAAARDFAIKQAQEKTFRDSNALSDFISTFARGKNTPAWAKAIFEGLLPFRRTPANILVRAFEYSPAGLISTMSDVARGKIADADVRSSIGQRIQEVVGKENVTADYVVGQLSKNITGTGLMALGFILAKLGFLRGGDDDDEKQAEFDRLTGRQPYSIEWEANGKRHSYTIDWVTPAAMPLFMGAELANISADGDISVWDAGRLLMSVTDPMMELGMLQGIQDTIENAQYSNSGFFQILASSALNNVTQAVTSTLGGQIERTFEPNRTMTYVDKNKDVPSWLQYQLGRASAKGIGEFGQTEYIDAWGRTESNGNFAERAFENFLSPGYSSVKEIDPVEEELQRVADATGMTSVLPDRADKKIGDVNLTAEQYTEYANTRGNEMYNLMQKVIDSSAYNGMSDSAKAEVLNDTKLVANAIARDAVGYAPTSGTGSAALKAKKNGVDYDDYLLYVAYRDIVDKPNDSGNYNTYTKEEKELAAKKAGITGKAFDYLTK